MAYISFFSHMATFGSDGYCAFSGLGFLTAAYHLTQHNQTQPTQPSTIHKASKREDGDHDIYAVRSGPVTEKKNKASDNSTTY